MLAVLFSVLAAVGFSAKTCPRGTYWYQGMPSNLMVMDFRACYGTQVLASGVETGKQYDCVMAGGETYINEFDYTGVLLSNETAIKFFPH